MKHLGDITKISGYDAPTVDCVIGGSPCQDLSVAGKRAGLAGERSGLYMEQIRIIKEMRNADALLGRADVNIRPRFMVWENVPGAFSSNGGKDFAAVLEEAIRVAEPEAPAVHVPEKGWPTSGCFWDEMGKWSVAWRVLDAQFWGVPQRRRRIALVADFGGLAAPEICFVRESVSGHSEPGKPQRKEAAGDVGGGIKPAGFSYKQGAKAGSVAYEEELAPSLLAGRMDAAVFDARGNGDGKIAPTITGDHENRVTDYTGIVLDDQGGSRISASEKGAIPTLRAEAHGNIPAVLVGTACGINGDIAGTLDASYYKGCGEREGREREVILQSEFCPDVAHTLKAKANCDFREDSETIAMQPILLESNQNHATVSSDGICSTLPASMGMGGGYVPMIASVDCRNGRENGALCGTLQSKPNGGFSYNCIHPVRVNHAVRRLTPLECERLQGYPDGWTDVGAWVDSKGKLRKPADSPRYKALGNSIAIPPWKWLLKRLCACYERDATMASLFDGIGGFPLIWEQLNGKGSCLWASEIEEFPMAVTKLRFGNE